MKTPKDFPTKADFLYWSLRQSLPRWTSGFTLPVKCSIDDVVNSHGGLGERLKNLDPHYGKHNVMNTLSVVRRQEQRGLRPAGATIGLLRNYATTGGGGFMAAKYIPIAKRWLRRIEAIHQRAALADGK